MENQRLVFDGMRTSWFDHTVQRLLLNTVAWSLPKLAQLGTPTFAVGTVSENSVWSVLFAAWRHLYRMNWLTGRTRGLHAFSVILVELCKTPTSWVMTGPGARAGIVNSWTLLTTTLGLRCRPSLSTALQPSISPLWRVPDEAFVAVESLWPTPCERPFKASQLGSMSQYTYLTIRQKPIIYRQVHLGKQDPSRQWKRITAFTCQYRSLPTPSSWGLSS